jgi:hypothetical protein
MIAAMIYNMWLTKYEPKYLFILGCIIAAIGAFFNLMFVWGWTLGLSPYVFMCITNFVSEAMYNAFLFMTSLILYAKLIPPNVEASLYAMCAGLNNLSNLFLANWTTLAWNAWF